MSTCGNPACTCTPCTCSDCKCGNNHLGTLERRVMDVVWDSPEAELTVRQVSDALPNSAFTTVFTVLDRLSQKGVVRRRSEGHSVFFAATGTRAEHIAATMHQALNDAPDPEPVLVEFLRVLPSETVSSLLDQRGNA